MNNSGFGAAEAIFMEDANYGAPLFYEPFSIDGSCTIETLARYEDNTAAKTGTIIEERGGIHYINQALLVRGGVSNQELNLDFKKLVDSIIG